MAVDWKLPATLTFGFHLVAFVTYVYSVDYDFKYVETRMEQSYGGKWKYLTFLNELLQTGYFGFCVLHDVFGSSTRSWEKRGSVQRFRDFLLCSLVFPMGAFVVASFWALYAVDRELVFPKALDGVVPLWLNHVMHTTVLLFLLLEKYFVYHHYPRRRSGISVTVAAAIIYQIWIFWIAYRANIWVYPVLQVLSWPGRCVFLAACWVLLMVIYVLGEWFTNAVWRPTHLEVKKRI